MRVDKDEEKERKNKIKHGFDFSFAHHISDDPFAVTIHDRYEDGEDRWHTFFMITDILLLVVHTYPDPDDDEWIRVIGLRKATAHERKRHEQGPFD